MKVGGFEVHPVAEWFPLIDGADFDALVGDIAEHGLRDPVVTDPDGVLLDGRNRVRACEKAGVEVQTRVYGGADVEAFIVSCNLIRRQLTDQQRAMIAAKMAVRFSGDRDRGSGVPDGTPDVGRPPARAEAAEMLSVSPRAVARARRVVTHGTPALQQLVADNRITLTHADELARDRSPEEQDAFVNLVVESGKRAADLRTRPRPTPAAAAPAPNGERIHAGTKSINSSAAKQRGVLDKAMNALGGIADAVQVIDRLQPEITSDEALEWRKGLMKHTATIRRLCSGVLQERINE